MATFCFVFFEKFVPEPLLLFLPLRVKRYNSLAEGMFHIDIFGDFFDLGKFLLSRILGHEINFEDDVVSILGPND